LLRRSILDRRRWLAGWSLGMAALSSFTVAFWPALRDKSASLNGMVNSLPASVRALVGMGSGIDPFSPLGYLLSKVFAFMLPLLLIIAAIGLAGSVPGDEEHGLLELTFALPISRRRVLVERWLAVVVLTAVLTVAAFVSLVITAWLVDLGVGIAPMAWASVSAFALTLSVAAISLAVGALVGRRGSSIVAAAVIAVVGYLVTSLAEAGIGFFQALRPISVFTHYDVARVLVSGAPSWRLLVLMGIAAFGTGVAVWGIDRRDLRTT
ncbi:MAG: ABC transporter permease subunit, partial [Actinomycetota bacterium]